MNTDRLQELCREYGVDPYLPGDPPDVRVDSSGESVSIKHEARRIEDARIGTEIGVPGTYVDDAGNVRPAVGRYGARKVRGTHSNWGLYEEHFRSEPQLYQPITAISEILAAATYEVQPPSTVKPEHEEWVGRYVEWTDGWLHSIEGGLSEHIREAAESVLIYGPAVHEVVWGLSSPKFAPRQWKHPVKFGYREPSTIEEWHLTDDESTLCGVEFERYDGEGEVLPAGGDLRRDEPRRRPDYKVAHTAYHQRGNNFEGVPPTRASVQYVKLKQLLIQIAGLTADKYGVPIPKVMDAPIEPDGTDEFTTAPAEGTATKSDKSSMFDDVKRMRAGEAPALKVPAGLDLEYEAPPGTMPTLRDLIEYCDQQIAHTVTNEGSLLGQQEAVGSYALGRVSDDRFLRQAPAVARCVLRPIDDIIRLHATQYLEPLLGERLVDYPTVEMRLGAGIDASQWLSDVTKAMGKRPITSWPPALQEAALDKLDLPEDALESDGDTEDVGGTRQTDREEGDDATG